MPAPPDLTPAEEAAAAAFGRVDADGTVWVTEAAGERVVGQYPGADPAEALALYVRRYADLRATVLLFETRLGADLSAQGDRLHPRAPDQRARRTGRRR